MKVLILTSGRKGTAGHHLPLLLDSGCCEVVAVIYSQGQVANKWRHAWRKARKMIRIGPLGALNGIRMRGWFDVNGELGIKDVQQTCAERGVPFHETAAINTRRTEELFRESGGELGISLGNSYITPGIFNIPRLGMINIHHELLPAFQNAQSIIWQLYHGSDTTGFTIHAIDRRIDTGNILLQRAIPIKFGPTLPATITQTMAALIEASGEGLVHCLRHFPELAAQAKPQGRGTAYTTPSLWQFLRIKRNWKKLVKGKVQTAQPSRD
ncbi:MAG: hypothetical protein KJZ58_07930 [Flavobacteriales bacterium]|nr:hypothetical protein [Flavobacteriales bacterium]MCL4282180.1 hypothetical protein [Flavobacteriales bacterium]